MMPGINERTVYFVFLVHIIISMSYYSTECLIDTFNLATVYIVPGYINIKVSLTTACTNLAPTHGIQKCGKKLLVVNGQLLQTLGYFLLQVTWPLGIAAVLFSN